MVEHSDLSDIDYRPPDEENQSYDDEDDLEYDDPYNHPDSFLHEQFQVESFTREMLDAYGWEEGNSDDTKGIKERLVRELATELHDDSPIKPYALKKDDWKNVLFILRRSCPDDDDKTYDEWIAAIAYMRSAASDADDRMKTEYQRLEHHVEDRGNDKIVYNSGI